jgi:hypothetical protein
VKNGKGVPNLPIPRNQEGQTFEQEQDHELESELLREIFGLDKQARVSYPE